MGFEEVYQILLLCFPSYNPQVLEIIAEVYINDPEAVCALVMNELSPLTIEEFVPSNHHSEISSMVDTSQAADEQLVNSGLSSSGSMHNVDDDYEHDNELFFDSECVVRGGETKASESLVSEKTLDEGIKGNADKCPESSINVSSDVDGSAANENDSSRSTIHGLMKHEPESSVQAEALVTLETDLEKSEASSSVEADPTTLPSIDIRSADIVDKLIAEAADHKKALSSAMESVTSLMKEVELKEKEAEQAKGEAASSGGSDVPSKGEELKDVLERAKDAKDMYTAEIYGEKAILATELRELQFRLLSIRDQRDKSLALLDEMRQALLVRLSVAEDEIKRAEERRLEKEKADREPLAKQQLELEQLFEEFKQLRKKAAENAELKDFLDDRGRVVDELQGEIDVICQDVELLKKNYEESLARSPITRCVLACSIPKSPIVDQPEPDLVADVLMKIQKNTDSVYPHSDAIFEAKEEAAEDGPYVLVHGEDWEFFECQDSLAAAN